MQGLVQYYYRRTTGRKKGNKEKERSASKRRGSETNVDAAEGNNVGCRAAAAVTERTVGPEIIRLTERESLTPRLECAK